MSESSFFCLKNYSFIMKYPTVYIQFPNGKIYPYKSNNLIKIDNAKKKGGVLVENPDTSTKKFGGVFGSTENIRNKNNYSNRGY